MDMQQLGFYRVFWMENKVDSWKHLSKYSAFLCKKQGKIDHDLLAFKVSFPFFTTIITSEKK